MKVTKQVLLDQVEQLRSQFETAVAKPDFENRGAELPDGLLKKLQSLAKELGKEEMLTGCTFEPREVRQLLSRLGTELETFNRPVDSKRLKTEAQEGSMASLALRLKLNAKGAIGGEISKLEGRMDTELKAYIQRFPDTDKDVPPTAALSKPLRDAINRLSKEILGQEIVSGCEFIVRDVRDLLGKAEKTIAKKLPKKLDTASLERDQKEGKMSSLALLLLQRAR